MAGTPLATVVRHLRRLAAPPPESDDALLRRFAAVRDESAFAQIVGRHGPLVLGVCRRVLRDEQDTEDAFQATFFVLARKAASVRRAGSLAGWLYRVACRIALQARAERVRRRLHERRTDTMRRPNEPATTWDDLRPILDEELQALPEKYRLPVVLCYLQGRTLTEAAADLGWPRGSVAGRLARARALLRQRLTRRGVTLSAALLAALRAEGVAPAAVPAALVGATAREAAVFVAGIAPASSAVALAEAALRAGPAMKGMVGAALLLGLTVLAAAGGLLSQAGPATQPPAAEARPGKEPSDAPRGKVDVLGDPLPAGAVARLGTVRLQQAFTPAIVYSPDGKLLASTDWDIVRLWDMTNGKETRHFRHEKYQWPGLPTFTAHGKTLITVGHDTVYAWDLASGGGTRHRLRSPDNRQELALSPDGKTLALLGKNVLHLWDWAAEKELRQVQNIDYPIAFWPDGTKVVAVVGEDVRRIDVATGESVVLLTKHRPDFLTLSPDGRTLATTDSAFTRLWDLATGKERLRLPARKNEATARAFSPDGKVFATASGVEPVGLWDAATGKALRRCDGRPDIFHSIAFAPDGKTLAAAGMRGTIQLFETATGKLCEPFPRPPAVGSTVVFRAAGKSLLTANGFTEAPDQGAVRSWDAITGKEQGHFLCHQDMNASFYGMALYWGKQVGQFLRDKDGEYVTPSADGSVVAISTFKEGPIHLRQVPTGKELAQLPGEHSWVVALNPDGTRLVTTRWDDPVLHLWDVAAGKELQRFEGHRTPVTRLALAPNGKSLASASTCVRGGDETLRIWDVATGKQRWNWAFPPAAVVAFTFSPDGKLLATVGHAGPTGEREFRAEVRLWDVAGGKEVRRWEAATGLVLAAAFAPDGHTLATGGETDNVVRLWEVVTGKERRIFSGHDGRVLSLSFAPDGRRLASASQDGTALVWALDRPPLRLSAEELKAEWDALAGDDAARAYRAAGRLAADPTQAVVLLRERLRPVLPPDARRIARLIADLDSEIFAVRDGAVKELARLGDVAAPALRQACAAKPSPEVRRRLEQLLADANGWPPDLLRQWRALEVLEQIGTLQARKVLEALSQGAPEARLTREAKAALARGQRVGSSTPADRSHR
jgi:RNA polymerase sigma factor (sigma-70 family)